MLRILLAAPVLLILVLFALSNPSPVEFRLWPTDLSVALPLSLAVLGAMAVAFLAGALVLWLSALAARRRARRAERTVRLLEAQVAELKARLAPPRPGPLVPGP
jgi:putative membrane protein